MQCQLERTIFLKQKKYIILRIENVTYLKKIKIKMYYTFSV